MCNVGNYVKSLFLLLLFSVSISAQSPGGFSYQAIVRNSAGTLVSNRTVSVRIQVLMGSVSGNVVYSENHNVMSNSNGLVTLIVGNGSNVVGSLLDIDWGNGLYFIQTDIDPTGGVNYSISSTSQLLSVPYALHAMRADELSGPVSFNQLTDVPESIGFSGDFEDLTNVPDLFEGDYNALSNVPDLALVATSGSYEDLQDAPVFHAVAASGSYEDLTNKPAFSSVATSGNYNDLQNKPEFAVVAQTGSYTDLTDKPIFFSGSYLDLLDKPNMEDSVNAYGFSGVYNDLIGRPTFSAVAVSGSYNDLTDRPNLSADGSFSGSYADLAGLPSFPDSIAKYGSGGAGGVSDYNQLLNKPNVKDSVERYGFSGSYTDLTDVPSFSSVATTGNYEDLQMLPNIKDSVERYGFNGNYYDLENVPEGRNNGDLMYWDADKNQRGMLSHGKEGDVLMMGACHEMGRAQV